MFDDESEMMKSREAEINARTDAKIESQNKKLDPESGQTFGEAFKNAKGQKTFMWRGKKYARVTADEKNKASVKDIVKRADLGPSKMLQEARDKAKRKAPVKPLTMEVTKVPTKAAASSIAPTSVPAPVPAPVPASVSAPARNPGAMSMDAFKPIRPKGYGCGGKVKMADGGSVCRGGGAATKGIKFRGVK